MLTGMKVKVCLQLYRGIFDMHVLPVLIANTGVCFKKAIILEKHVIQQ